MKRAINILSVLLITTATVTITNAQNNCSSLGYNDGYQKGYNDGFGPASNCKVVIKTPTPIIPLGPYPCRFGLEKQHYDKGYLEGYNDGYYAGKVDGFDQCAQRKHPDGNPK
jgi:hypothetical protein